MTSNVNQRHHLSKTVQMSFSASFYLIVEGNRRVLDPGVGRQRKGPKCPRKGAIWQSNYEPRNWTQKHVGWSLGSPTSSYFILYTYNIYIYIYIERERAHKGLIYIHTYTYICNMYTYIFGYACNMQKFLNQGSNPRHGSDLSHSSDNTRSLTAKPTRKLQ